MTRIGGYTPLHVAAKSGAAEVVRLLVDAKAERPCRDDHRRRTAALCRRFRQPRRGRDPARRRRRSERPRAAVGPDAADVRGRRGSDRRRPQLLTRGADPRVAGKVVNISERNRQDSADSRARNTRIAAIQKERAAKAAAAAAAGKPAATAAPAARRARNADGDNGGEPEPLGYARSRRRAGRPHRAAARGPRGARGHGLRAHRRRRRSSTR